MIGQFPNLRWRLERAGYGASLYTALERDLGLTLVPGTAEAPTVVIDRVERPFGNL